MKRGQIIFLIIIAIVTGVTHFLKSDYYGSNFETIKDSGAVTKVLDVSSQVKDIGSNSVFKKWDYVVTKYQILPVNFRWVFNIALIFSLSNITLFCIIIFKRYKLDKQAKVRKKYIDKYRELLTYLIFTDREDKNDDTRLRYNDIFKNLKNEIKNPYKRELLREILFTAHRDIRGKPSRRIMSLFIDFDYHNYAEQKLKSSNWSTKIKGIRELSRMQMKSFVKDFFDLFDHKNIQVRRESGIGIGRLLEYSSIRYLNNIKRPLSNWYQLELLDNVSRFRSDKQPDMSRGLTSRNDTVVSFTVKLLRHLNQIDSVDKQIETLKTKTKDIIIHREIRIGIIHNLYIWRVDKVKDYLKELFVTEVNSEVKQKILAYFERLGTKEDLEFLIKTLSEQDYVTNIKSIRIIKKLEPTQLVLDKMFKVLDEDKHELVKYYITPKLVAA